MVVFEDLFGRRAEFLGDGSGRLKGLDAVGPADGLLQEEDVPDLEAVGVVDLEEIGERVAVFGKEFARLFEVEHLIKFHTTFYAALPSVMPSGHKKRPFPSEEPPQYSERPVR